MIPDTFWLQLEQTESDLDIKLFGRDVPEEAGLFLFFLIIASIYTQSCVLETKAILFSRQHWSAVYKCLVVGLEAKILAWDQSQLDQEQ